MRTLAQRGMSEATSGNGLSRMSLRSCGLKALFNVLGRREARPERWQLRSVADGHGCCERATIQDGIHHAGEAGGIRVMQKSDKQSRLPVRHLGAKRRVRRVRRLREFDASKNEHGARTFDGNMIAAPNGVARLDYADTFRAAPPDTMTASPSRNQWGRRI